MFLFSPSLSLLFLLSGASSRFIHNPLTRIVQSFVTQHTHKKEQNQSDCHTKLLLLLQIKRKFFEREREKNIARTMRKNLKFITVKMACLFYLPLWCLLNAFFPMFMIVAVFCSPLFALSGFNLRGDLLSLRSLCSAATAHCHHNNSEPLQWAAHTVSMTP